MPDIFVSYAREDESRVAELVLAFENQHWSVYWDRRIPAGKTYRSHIGGALANAKCVVVAWSRHSIESQFVAEEAEEGSARSILVPILIDPVMPPLGFRSIHAADLTGWQRGRPTQQFDRLVEDISKVLQESRPGQTGTADTRREMEPPRTNDPSASGFKFDRRMVGYAILAVTLVSGLGYLGIRSRGSGPQSTSPPVARSELPTPSSTSGSNPTVPTGKPMARVVEVWRVPGGGMALRVEIKNGGAVPLTFDAASALRLVGADSAPMPPTRTVPVFDTIQAGDALIFEVQFPASPGATALRLLPPIGGDPIDLPLSADR